MIKKIDEYITGYFNELLYSNERILIILLKIALYGFVAVFGINLLFNREGFGQWGDFLGGVLNPILTFLTFIGLLVTIYLQQKELQETRKEFERQSKALEQQQDEMSVQTFDNKFFQMLDLFNFVKINTSRAKSFKQMREELEGYIKKSFDEYKKLRLASDTRDKYSFFEENFIRYNNEYSTIFKYYFLNLFQLLKYIDKNADSLFESKEYTNIVRAQLSTDELVLLLLNGIGVQKFTSNDYQKLLEKYEFFEHLRYNELVLDTTIKNIIDCVAIRYDSKAFGKNDFMLRQLQYAKERYESKS